MAAPMVEPSWWGDQDAVAERRALTEAFNVDDLEEATVELRARCQRLERARSRGEVVTVGEVAEVLVGQWSVAFHARLADAQHALCASGDHDRGERLARAAEDGRAAAVAVRDRYLAPDRISGHSLQQALNLANVDASGLRPDRSAARQLRPEGQLPEAITGDVIGHDGGVSAARLGLLPAERLAELITPGPAEGVRARLLAKERARAAAAGGTLIHDHAAQRQSRAKRRGLSM